MLEGDFPDDASQPEPGLDGARPTGTWIDEYGGVPEGSNLLTWIAEEELPSPPPYHCEKCQGIITGETTGEKRCRADNCVIVYCAWCDHEYGSFGPVGCPCQDRDPKIRRIRVLYRRRKK